MHGLYPDTPRKYRAVSKYSPVFPLDTAHAFIISWLIQFICPALPCLILNPSRSLSCFTGALSFLSSAHSFHARTAQAVLCLVFYGIRLSFLFSNSSSLISDIFLLFCRFCITSICASRFFSDSKIFAIILSSSSKIMRFGKNVFCVNPDSEKLSSSLSILHLNRSNSSS